MNRIRKFLKADDAIAVTEYALLIALVAVVLVAVVLAFGTKLSSWFAAKTNSITTV
ncbi:MAG: Flp family type IVb pilin [Gemmatimonadaceae bacterium]|nr:Flp family type IVb pilin [Gemmatimonadaceae bacterium]